MKSLPLRLAALLALLASAAAGVGVLFAQQPPADSPPPPTTPAKEPAPAVGKAGCAAVACHGATADLTKLPGSECWQESATRFQAADPHPHAYEVLKSKEAKQMMARLGPGYAKDAENEKRCLACHTNPRYAEDTALRADGIGCAGCHGESDNWLQPHTSWGKNPDKRPAEHKEGIGGLNNIGTRAKTCAGCHVGAPEDKAAGIPVRDMNHDMIAAGHPRLFFDLAELHRRLPKHWSEKDRTDPTAKPPAETHLWLVGRVAHAEAACELLADRAGRKASWPEFAEGNCASCHHAIQPNGTSKLPGVPRWQALWPLTETNAELKALKKLMEVKGVPDAAVGRKATEAAAKLKALREEWVKSPPKADDLFPKTADTLDPDELLQVLHGLAAAEREKPSERGPKIAEAFGTFTWPTTPPADIPKVREKVNGLLLK